MTATRTAALLALTLSACAPAQQAPPSAPSNIPAIEKLHESVRVEALNSRVFTHAEYWAAVEPSLTGAVTREQIGASAEGRPIQLLRYGNGPTRVLMWSQMHGDESTATLALADLLNYLQMGDARTRNWREQLTILMIPLLNPDGAERFTRHNSYGIDINRDARMLSTPEARALKATHDRFKPEFGFNLHDQSVRTLIEGTDRIAAIALLAPAFDESRSDNPVRIRAKQVAAVVRDAVEPLVAGNVAKYDDSFNPRAFGDLVQQWGTSTVLIESGGWAGDPEKQHLRKANFVALVAALDAIATGSYRHADSKRYEALPFNGSSAYDLLIRGGTIVLPGHQPYRADIAIDAQQQFNRTVGARVAEIGDLSVAQARDTLDVTGLFVHPDSIALSGHDARVYLGRGGASSFVIRRTDGSVAFSVRDVTVTRH